ncbi:MULTISPECIES: DUF4145 domain-containing protein [unclassified Psychrobacter]|uniref:DUF4145 domain-containing protein n=1 Tax=unclassified Psychrobacter TaxID=196806 RepID=UPI0025B39526|nr:MULTISPECIES: DUF4145 domain-containing protein [unclassified Psychrobacter]MDN3453257.1 DUF4145 domain-containing protein [Psychrobacter sp. APC 3350]MDN3503489.1 DUF4145 domain-containing protein [Psychrobacter sp. 5A.1]
MSKSWQCPFCNNHSTVNNQNMSSGDLFFDNENKLGRLNLKIESITCPNPDCREFVLEAHLFESVIKNSNFGSSYVDGSLIYSWKLHPQSTAKPLPDYIPTAIKADYKEACSILNLSPKASATLARRCLQGMIRNFWEVKPQNLFQEIESIKDKVEPDTWEAIDVVRKVGNIGAHMEKDINQIVEVDENEASLLIGLIEMLIEEWYVSRYERKQRLAQIKQLGQDKDVQRKMKSNPVTPN